MKRLPVSLFIEEAPVDPFDPKGEQQYRLVAVIPSRETEVILSEAHGSVLAAMLDAWNEGVFNEIDRVRLNLADHDRILGSLGRTVALHGRQLGYVRRTLRAVMAWSASASAILSTRKNTVTPVADRAITDDGDWWWSPDPEMVRRASASPPVRPNGS